MGTVPLDAMPFFTIKNDTTLFFPRKKRDEQKSPLHTNDTPLFFRKKGVLRYITLESPPIFNVPMIKKDHLFQLQYWFRLWILLVGEILKVPSSQTGSPANLAPPFSALRNRMNETVRFFLRYVFFTVFPCLKTAAKQKKTISKV